MVQEIHLGQVLRIGADGTLLVKAKSALPVQVGGRRDGLRIGMTATDNRRERAGRVVDILGPVAEPYVVLRPERGAPLHRLLGKDLYVAPHAQPPAQRRPHGQSRGGPPQKRSFRPREGRDRRDGRR